MMWHSLIKERKSQIFISVLIIFAIIMGLGAALLFHSRSARDISRLQSEAARAYSLARSGLDIGQRLASGVDFDRTYNIGGGTLRIQLAVGTGTLTSTGTVGKSTRVLAKNFSLPLIGGLPKTGQELCYAASGTVIPCSGSGNDAYYADPAGPDVGQTKGNKTWLGWNATDGTGRFTNNGDGTITDNATGLMWVADPCDAGLLNGTGACFGWYSWTAAITACENLTYPTGGYNDWRLPNIKELMSIVDYGTSSPSIDTNFFACQQVYYWTSTTSPVSSSNAYVVYFYDGLGSSANTDKTTFSALARPVRGGSEGSTTGFPKTGQEVCYNASGAVISCSGSGNDAEYANPAGSYDIGYTRGEGTWAGWNENGGRFTNNGDGTITDNATGLMWVANPTNAGVGGTYTWVNAITACENLTYPTGGYNDWRLPNIKELMSIVDYGTSSPSIDTNFFSCVSNNYWTSTSYTPMPGSLAWSIYFGTQNFSTGDVNPPFKSFPYYLRPVRGGISSISPPPPQPTINQIRVVMVFQGTIKTYLRLNGVESMFPGQGSGSGAWMTRTTGWSPNRPGGGNWTWDDVENLQVAIGLSIYGGTQGKLTQVYVEVQHSQGSLILRPNGTGDYTNIEGPPGSHWELVDDVVSDGNATYIWTNSATEQKDAYQLTDPTWP